MLIITWVQIGEVLLDMQQGTKPPTIQQPSMEHKTLHKHVYLQRSNTLTCSKLNPLSISGNLLLSFLAIQLWLNTLETKPSPRQRKHKCWQEITKTDKIVIKKILHSINTSWLLAKFKFSSLRYKILPSLKYILLLTYMIQNKKHQY